MVAISGFPRPQPIGPPRPSRSPSNQSNDRTKGWINMWLRLFLVCAAVLSCSAADRILFSRLGPSETGLYVSNADGSGESALPKGSLDYNPAWSTDGKWIAFTSDRGGAADLYRMRQEGTGGERLTDDPGFDDQASFSPDGSQIVFVTTRAGGTADLWIL